MRPECILALASAATLCFGQQPAFEVASIRPTVTREINGLSTYPGGRVEWRGCSLKYLVTESFGLDWYQVSGGPEWISYDRYDLEAKPPASSKTSRLMPAERWVAPNDEQRQMLQALLAERFQLQFHRETREGPVDLLKRGSRPLKLDDAKNKNAFPWSGGLHNGAVQNDGMAGINESMQDFAKRLGPYFERPVLDRTGIAGSFDFRFEYHTDERTPDLFTVITESLRGIGLKLETAKGPVERLVIDHAEKATSN
jgi:uncharacterized protein (TIGR03435 family)